MKEFFRYVAAFIIVLLSGSLYAQKSGYEYIDSLVQELPKRGEDTNKVKLLVRISDCYYYSFDTSLRYVQAAASLAQKLRWEKGMGMVNRCIGDAYYQNHDFATGLEYYFESLEICEKYNDTKDGERVLAQLVMLYKASEDYNKALEYATKLIDTRKAIGDKAGMAQGMYCAASVYARMHIYPKALEYSLKRLALLKELGDGGQIITTEQMIGSLYHIQGDSVRALQHYHTGLRLAEAANDITNTKVGLLQIGEYYSLQSNAKALDYFNRIIQLDRDAGDSESVTNDYYPLIRIYLRLQDYAKALEYGLMILKDNKATNSSNTKYALGKIGTIYYHMALDSPGSAAGNPDARALYLAQAKDYFFQSGIRPSLLTFSKLGSDRDDENYYPELIEVEELLGDYKGAYQSLKAYKALKDTEGIVNNKRLIGNMEVKRASVEGEKKAAIERITANNKRNERMFYGGGIVLLSLLVVVAYRNFRVEKKANTQLAESNRIITKEKERSDDLLLNILPSEVAEELKEKGVANARKFDHVTVLFTDFVNFTGAGERMTPQILVGELHTCFKAFDEITSKYGVEKIKTIGDAYLAVAGLPTADPKHGENVVRAAIEITAFMQERYDQMSEGTFKMRIGIHSGSVVAGIVGVKKFAYDIWGDTVNTAARMEQNSESGRINISETTYELVRDKIACTYRGEVNVKGKGLLKMYYVG